MISLFIKNKKFWCIRWINYGFWQKTIL